MSLPLCLSQATILVEELVCRTIPEIDLEYATQSSRPQMGNFSSQPGPELPVTSEKRRLPVPVPVPLRGTTPTCCPLSVMWKIYGLNWTRRWSILEVAQGPTHQWIREELLTRSHSKSMVPQHP